MFAERTPVLQEVSKPGSCGVSYDVISAEKTKVTIYIVLPGAASCGFGFNK